MEEIFLPNLPNEIGIQSIARVPRSFHPNLSLVCRSWRSLLRSSLFYSTRCDLKCTQHFLYFNTTYGGRIVKWYVLDTCDENPRKIKPLPPFPPPIGFGFASVVLGPCLYVLGGSMNGGILAKPIVSSDVWVYDARTNTWEAGPNMIVGRMFHHATVINGKIYVVGGDFNFSTVFPPWAEVLDPTLGSWMPLHSPLLPTVFGNARVFDICCGVGGGKLLVLTTLDDDEGNYIIRDTEGVFNLDDGEGNYIIRDTEGVFFDPESSSWWIERAPFHSNLGWYSPQRSAVVGGIVYLLDSSFKIKGYDAEENRWKELKVIDMETLYRPFDNVMLANVEGSLWVIWHCTLRVKEGFDYQNLKWIDKNSVLREFHQVEKDFLLRECRKDEIYFVLWEINVCKESDGGLQGSIVRSKIILTIPNTFFDSVFLPLGL
ncbi:F-box/kelch-repeat protein SKIP6-like [Tasmannia lanceolata]|uniref:F-box/kelch-repeat protein SKIP6-like n=1 Tax=Tasmannia lanceolata TaxID=3420 RepID=UPI004062910B